jgi:predicted DNA-binding transcriptional regulator YafY
MARSQRLLELLQLLRTYRYAVTADVLARELEVSVRTVYRDIATLQAQGASIEGEAGVGYVLRPGFTLPPLMFSVEEIEAFVLGVSWVADRADKRLADAARNLVAKVKAVLPGPLRQELEATTLLVGPAAHPERVSDEAAAALRGAIRSQTKVRIAYRDDRGQATERTVWPFGLGYFDSVLVLLAWCELRQDLRNFRADRILRWESTRHPYPESRSSLLERWRLKEGLEPGDVYL